MVTICTTSLTFNNSTFCPHTVFMCFVWISEQTSIISLYNINWLVCIIETQCVYCAVRTGYLNANQVSFHLKGKGFLPTPFANIITVLTSTVMRFYFWRVTICRRFEISRKANKSLVMCDCPSVRPHGTKWLPLDEFSWNLICDYFSEFCRVNSSFIKIWQW